MKKKEDKKETKFEEEAKEIKLKTNVKAIAKPKSMIKLDLNANFCNNIFNKPNLSKIFKKTEKAQVFRSLTYKRPKDDSSFEEALQTILSLLFQLKEAQADPNIFVNNNTVIKDQIINQLKNEILKAKGSLAPAQIENLEVVSSNAFDEKQLEDVIKSLLKKAKKKLIKTGEHITEEFRQKYETHFETLENITKNYSKILNITEKNEKIIKNITKTKTFQATASRPSDEWIRKNLVKEREILNLNIKNVREKATEQILVKNKKAIEQIKKTYEKKLITQIHPITPLIKLATKTSTAKILVPAVKTITSVLQKPSLRQIFSKPSLIYKKIFNQKNLEETENVTPVFNEKETRNITEKKVINTLKKENLIKEKKLLKSKALEKIENNSKKVINNIFENQKFKEKLENLKVFNVSSRKNLEILKNKINVSETEKTKNEKETRNITEKKVINTLKKENLIKEKKLLKSKALEKIENNSKKVINNIFENQKFKEKLENLKVFNVSSKKNLEILKNKISVSETDLLNLEKAKIQKKEKDITKSNIKNEVQKLKEIHSKNIINLNKKLISQITEKDLTENVKTFESIFSKNIVKNLIHKKIQNTESNFFEEVAENKIEKVYKENQYIKNLRISEKNIVKNIYKFNKSILKEKINVINKAKGNDKLIFGGNKIIKKIFKEEPKKLDFFFNDDLTKHRIYKDEFPKVFKENEERKNKEEKKKPKEVKVDKEIKEKTFRSEPNSIQNYKLPGKLLSESDVENIVQNHIKGINVDEISHTIMERVEEKLTWDKKRNGIF